MRRWVVVTLLLAGCSSAPKVPTVTFEAAGFLKVYLAERDAVIRQTATAVRRCAVISDTAAVELRKKCAELDAIKAEWDRRDALVYSALMTGQTVKSIDWELAAEIAGKFLGLAAGIAM